ncbi:nitrite reductase (NAD(P)H) small subunit [Jatrophihabitans sp. YIM 134969]
MTATTTRTDVRWSPVCSAAEPARGQAIGLHVGGHAVALFRTHDGELFALSDVDPHAGPEARAGALSAGRLASRRDVPTVVAVASGRQFELARGTCVDGCASVTPFPVRVTDGAVEVAVPAA